MRERDLLAILLLIQCSFAQAPQSTFATLSTLDGNTYTNAVVRRTEGMAIVIVYKFGVASLALTNLQDSTLGALGLPSHAQQMETARLKKIKLSILAQERAAELDRVKQEKEQQIIAEKNERAVQKKKEEEASKPPANWKRLYPEYGAFIRENEGSMTDEFLYKTVEKMNGFKLLLELRGQKAE